jgi:hypothetical protein
MQKINNIKKTVVITSIVAGSLIAPALLRSETQLSMQSQKPQTTEKSLKSDQKTMQNLIREDIALEKSVLRVTTENKKLMNEIAILNRKDDKYGNLDIGVFITGGLLFLTAASISLISFLSRW